MKSCRVGRCRESYLRRLHVFCGGTRGIVPPYILSVVFSLLSAGSLQAGVDYTRDVRPILSQHCFKCHGPDDAARKAGLRLDLRDTAVKQLESGETAIVPKATDRSELLRRINADDGEVMPPPSTKKPLNASQKETLRRWIAEGAEYKTHWSFIPPTSPPPPKVKRTDWLRTPIDAFILAKLEAAGLSPSPEADRYTLARRVSLDLVGLPPTPAELDAFVNDPSPDAYERYVDRLLASPRYGERWARRWLDLARYADTNGYEKDRIRSIWPYRDWVIDALNADKPYDRFSIEQLSGDMLPGAGLSERIATGFHRNTMINEEGGVDPLEFRFHAMTDRVAVTSNVWLGLTFQCAQCHTHKFDPIQHRDYYALMAFMDNAEEPVIEVPTPEQEQRRKEIEALIAKKTAALADSFVIEEGFDWRPATVVSFRSISGVGVEFLADHSVRLKPNGKPAERDDYILTTTTDATAVDAIRLETLADDSLPSRGAGLTPHGNFVLTEFSVAAAGKPISLVALKADVTQHEFSPAATLDKNNKTGWAVDVAGKLNQNHQIDYVLQQPITTPTPLTIRIEQRYGGGHTIGRFRVMLGKRRSAAPLANAERRRVAVERYKQWANAEMQNATNWRYLYPTELKATTAYLESQNKGGWIGSYGDISKSETYAVRGIPSMFLNEKVTAIRLEAFADPRLPGGGPGRVYYEGPPGDFFLSEVTVTSDGKPVKITSATADYSSGSNTPTAAIDGDPQTGWSINGGQGKDHRAVFVLETPVSEFGLEIRLLFERYYAAPLGAFRLSVTADADPKASSHPDEIEKTLNLWRIAKQEPRYFWDPYSLWAYYLRHAPETAAARAEIEQLRTQLPKPSTTLVMEERDVAPRRVTQRRHRGEYLQPKEIVKAATPSALPKPRFQPSGRLEFARWLVSKENPLCDRVAVNREWSAFFGRGIVRTAEDFGSQGETPSHPELLDWLAVEFRRSGMSMKRLHRLIVTSAVYRQSTRISPELLARDSDNALLGCFPGVRLEAEIIRDSMLAAAGLLSQKMKGPSVFPPQPPGVSSEGAYGPLAWKESQGEDRFRRGLYTFSKRTAPYSLFATFDAPSGEACVVRREVSNTPLQALSTLNDRTVVEASQAIGRWASQHQGKPEEIANGIAMRCLGRPATAEETTKIVAFFEKQKQRLAAGELDAKKLAGGEMSASAAAWTAVARALLNLHEAVTKP
jgi:hypothetical protein